MIPTLFSNRNSSLHPSSLIAPALLIVAILVRVFYSLAYWQWFDQTLPDLWHVSFKTLSPDGNRYVFQALAAKYAQGPIWADEGFFRPPLASFVYQVLFLLFDFNRVVVYVVQSCLSVTGYWLLFLSVRKLVSNEAALLFLLLVSVHPVLIFFDASFEDSPLAFLFLSAGISLVALRSNSLNAPIIVAAGICFAMAVLARPNLLTVLVLVALYIWFYGNRNGQEYKPKHSFNYITAFRQFYVLVLISVTFFALNLFITGRKFSDSYSIFGNSKLLGDFEYALVAFLWLAAAIWLFSRGLKTKDSTIVFIAGCFASVGLICSIVILPILLLLLFLIRFRIKKNVGWYNPQEGDLCRKRYITPLILILPVMVAVLLSAIHNYRATGRNALVTTTLGQNMLWGNGENPEYRIILQGFPYERWLIPHSVLNTWLTDIRARYPAPTLDISMQKAAIDWILKNPVDALAIFVTKAQRFISNYEIPRNRNFEVIREDLIWLRVPYIPFSILVVFATATLFLYPHKRYLLLFFIPAVAVFITEVLFFNSSRYRSIALPFLLVFLFPAIKTVFNWMKDRQFVPLTSIVVLAVVGFYLGETAVSKQERNGYRSATLYKMADTQLVRDKPAHLPGDFIVDNPELFERRLTQSLELYPDNYSAFHLLQMWNIFGLNNSSEARKQLHAYHQRCVRDSLCQNIERRLVWISQHPKRYVRILKRSNY